MTDSHWSQETLDTLAVQVRNAHGLDLAFFDASFLAKALDNRAAALEMSAEACGARLAWDIFEAETLFGALRNGHSEFFRNALAFAFLEHVLLPGLFEAKEQSGRGEVRIWSAGCATGQEAWSLAILLDALNRARNTPIPTRIIATDWFAPDLAVARAGLYSEDAVGNVRMHLLRRYFTKEAGAFRIVPRLTDRVEFTVYDLLDETTICPPESIFGNFDLVYCSNVLLYYRQECRQRMLAKIWRCLTPGGCLVTDETEAPIVERAGGFRRAVPQTPIFSKKKGPPHDKF